MVVSQHIMETNHNFDWDNPKILNHDRNYYKRLISETIHIKQQHNGLNASGNSKHLDS